MDLGTQVRFAKGWIRARLTHLKGEVQTQLADCSATGGRDCTVSLHANRPPFVIGINR